MRVVSLAKILFVLTCYSAFQLGTPHPLLAQSGEESDGLSTSEKEELRKAKDPDQQLKVYLEIASDRLKTILSMSHKGDVEATRKAVTGYRTAVSGADDTVAKGLASGKNMKKELTTLLKATRKYNFSLLQALEKAPEDLRMHIQAAHEVSMRVQEGVSLQLEKSEKKSMKE